MKERRVFVYDLDNTLIDTTARVKMLGDDGRVVGYINAQGYNDLEKTCYDQISGNKLDYSQFRTLRYLMHEPKTTVFEMMQRCYNNGDTIYIVTARPVQHIIYKWLVKNKIFLDKRNVICFKPNDGVSVSRFKMDSFAKILNMYGEDNVCYHVYEDDEMYMKAMMCSGDEGNYKITYHTVWKTQIGITTGFVRSPKQIRESLIEPRIQLNN